jgi:hypothetical protein
MADFASVGDAGRRTRINLEHVTRITPGVDPREPATVSFVRGKSLALPAAEGRSLVNQLNRCCRKRKEA